MNAPVTCPLGRAFTTREAAQFLGIGLIKLRRLIAAGQIRVLRAGKLVIYEQWCIEFRERHAPLPAEEQQAIERAALRPQPRPQGIEALMPRERKFSQAS